MRLFWVYVPSANIKILRTGIFLKLATYSLSCTLMKPEWQNNLLVFLLTMRYSALTNFQSSSLSVLQKNFLRKLFYLLKHTSTCCRTRAMTNANKCQTVGQNKHLFLITRQEVYFAVVIFRFSYCTCRWQRMV